MCSGYGTWSIFSNLSSSLAVKRAKMKHPRTLLAKMRRRCQNFSAREAVHEACDVIASTFLIEVLTFTNFKTKNYVLCPAGLNFPSSWTFGREHWNRSVQTVWSQIIRAGSGLKLRELNGKISIKLIPVNIARTLDNLIYLSPDIALTIIVL